MRAEEILDAVVTLVTGLTTTGSNVFRGQVYDIPDASLPAISIFMGEDTLDEELSNSLYDWSITIYVESKAEEASTQIDETLNTIRAEVHAGLFSVEDLGLSFVFKVTPIRAEEPVLSAAGSKPMGTQKLEYQVMYRTSRTNLNS